MQIISNIKPIEDNGDGYYEDDFRIFTMDTDVLEEPTLSWVYWEIHANGTQIIIDEACDIVHEMEK